MRPSPRPRLLVSMSMTADGKIASSDRSITRFGSARDLEHLYERRARADAILCGARTLELSRARLGNGPTRFRKFRLEHGLAPAPLRIVVSGRATLSPEAPIWSARFSPIIALTTEAAGPTRLNRLRRLADAVRVYPETGIDFADACSWLRREWGVTTAVAEGGAGLNGALIRAGLVDTIHLTLCPVILGGRTAPTLASGAPLRHLADATRFRLASVRRHDDELYLVYAASRRRGHPAGAS